MTARWRRQLIRQTMVAVAALGLMGTAAYVPAALAFPYHARIGATQIYAERAIPASIHARLARADALLAASPLDIPGLARTIVLTDGGWRWTIMAAGSTGVIALRRPFASVMVFHRGDVARDRVSNGAAVGGVRTLSGTIAHEMTHVLVARRYGEIAMARMPAWLREGYADHVAQETSIGGAADEAAIRRASPGAPVLVYYEGRRRVAAILARNGGSVDALFARP